MEPPPLPDQDLKRTFWYHNHEIVVEARLEDRGGNFVFFPQWTLIDGHVRHFNQGGESYATAALALHAAEERARRDVDLRPGG